jgi:hypothetical protein
VKAPRKAVECGENVGKLSHRNISDGMWPGSHRGLGAGNAWGYKAAP